MTVRIGTKKLIIFDNRDVMIEEAKQHVYLSKAEMDELCRKWLTGEL